jgi:hypothetical protein
LWYTFRRLRNAACSPFQATTPETFHVRTPIS